MAATGERDTDRQTDRRKKERKRSMSNRTGRYGQMLSPSSVTSLRVIAIFILLLPSGWLQNIQKTRPSTRQAYTWNHIFKTRGEGSISSSIETSTFLSLQKKCLVEKPPEGGEPISMFYSISFTLAGNPRMYMCQTVPQKTHPVSLCAQGTCISRTKRGWMPGPVTPGRWVGNRSPSIVLS